MKNVYSRSFESAPPPRNINNCKAFTLPEVLITLGIIGVVAALTMPSLVANYQKKATAIKVKKFYTNFNQAIKLSEIENGDFKYWTYNNSNELYDNYLAKYLKVVQVQRNIHMYGNFTGGIKFIFSDGTQAICSPKTNLTGYGNGAPISPCIFYTRGINKWVSNAKEAGYSTHSVFWFLINENGILEPPYMTSPRSSLIKLCEEINNKGNGMTTCGTLLYKDNWEIKDDYPW